MGRSHGHLMKRKSVGDTKVVTSDTHLGVAREGKKGGMGKGCQDSAKRKKKVRAACHLENEKRGEWGV